MAQLYEISCFEMRATLGSCEGGVPVVSWWCMADFVTSLQRCADSTVVQPSRGLGRKYCLRGHESVVTVILHYSCP